MMHPEEHFGLCRALIAVCAGPFRSRVVRRLLQAGAAVSANGTRSRLNWIPMVLTRAPLVILNSINRICTMQHGRSDFQPTRDLITLLPIIASATIIVYIIASATTILQIDILNSSMARF